MTEAYAHSLPGQLLEFWEPLSDHQLAVAELAKRFAEIFGWGRVAEIAGLLHDIGKLSLEFQAYIRQQARSGGDHSAAGARISLDAYRSPLGQLLAAIIAAHHAGLADGVDLAERMARATVLVPAGWAAQIERPLPEPRELLPLGRWDLRAGAKGFAWSFVTRMLFSCLVDADFIATEAFYAKANGLSAERGGHVDLAELRRRLRSHMDRKRANAPPTPVNVLRADILSHVEGRAELAPGLFTLTVPTGGGKTLASLSFALEHACRHDLRRVVYVSPYTSIIEQTAQVFRDALATDHDILEHHASFDWEKVGATASPDDDAPDALAKLRRAAENWDVPVVVTTAVQFFESLFANRTSRCRKLHNIAGSVVVLDEVQTLPLSLLKPCMAALDELARHYRCSIVLCTATQPALRAVDGFKDGFAIDAARELAPEPERLYRALRRVEVERLPGPVPDETIVARFEAQPQMLCIFNTRDHARKLYDLIAHLPGATHLTTLMCPRHRRIVLAELRERLKRGEPVRLVATSLIEAGVDISFPEVWRAAAGLDSIAQAAGRSNREGELPAGQLGRVVVFEPAEVRPQHEIKQRWEASQAAFRGSSDPLGLDGIRSYFQQLYWSKGADRLDSAKIDGHPGLLSAIAERASDQAFPFRSLAEAFRMIDEVMEPVIVPWRADADDDEAERLLAGIAAQERPSGRDLRRLQQYVVSIPPKARQDWLARGVLKPVHPMLGETLLRFEDLSHYREETGVDLAEPTYRDSEGNVF